VKRLRLLAAFLTALAFALVPSTAVAAMEVEPGSASFRLLNAAGEPEVRAGAHPDRLIAKFAFTKTADGKFDENLRDLYFDLPPGFVGNPFAIPSCSRTDFLEEKCPKASQVGIARLRFNLLGDLEIPAYNIEPAGGEVAEIAFNAFLVQGRFRITLRPGDGGMHMEASEFPQELPMEGTEIELWGVPADHQTEEAATPRRPFLTNSTSCGPSPPAIFGFRTWQKPERWKTTPLPLPGLVGCENLPLSASLSVTPGEFEADSPTGLEIALAMEQHEDPDGLVSAQPRTATVALPRGFSLSPAVATGLAACTDAEFAAGSDVPANCPPASRIGSARFRSPALAGDLEGRVYIATSAPGGPFRTFLVGERPGFRVKLPVTMRADASGSLVAELSNLPQLPVSSLVLSFDGGPRAPLASPQSCGAGTATATLVPYGGEGAEVTAGVITSHGPGGSACGRGRPFGPSFAAGSSSPVAGRGTGFAIALRRSPGEQSLAGMEVEMPPGLVADTAGVGRCDGGALAAASCPAEARVGSTVVEAGSGPQPLALGGEIYLTGPYRGAPFGLAMLIPIQVGPFQLGTATIRSALALDPETGQLTVKTDPLPQVVNGIPLRIRSVGIDIGRPGFMRNPTSCTAGTVEAKVSSAEGAITRPSVPFQLTNCDRLRFGPKLSIALRGASDRFPGLRIGVRSKDGGANLRAMTMRLPGVLSLNRETSVLVCARESFELGACPDASLVGHAQARSPLISEPLRGPVRLVQATTVGPPELWTELSGGGVRIVTRTATGQSAGGRLVTRITNLPDFSLRSLTTTLRSGPRSLFKATRPVCRGVRPLAEAKSTAHNGATSTQLIKVKVSPFACSG
jgi:hypothetical protein